MEILTELLPCIRFPYLPIKFIVEQVEPMSQWIPVLKDILYEVYRYKAYPEDKKSVNPLRIRPRKGIHCSLAEIRLNLVSQD